MPECKCDDCKGACKSKPGWFMPGEAEKAAKLLNLTLQEFFNKYLGVDWWEPGEGIDEDVFVLVPAILDIKPGSEYPGNPQGQCVFFKNGLCKIHAVKPFECKAYMHNEDDEFGHARHLKVAKAWQKRQAQIYKLLGREPIASEYCSDVYSEMTKRIKKVINAG